jgi:hypothetical protein
MHFIDLNATKEPHLRGSSNHENLFRAFHKRWGAQTSET